MATELNIPVEPVPENGSRFAMKEKLSMGEAILQRIRLRAKLRVLWLQKIWSAYNAEKRIHDIAPGNPEILGYLENIDDPQAEERWRNQNESLGPLQIQLKEVERKLRERSTNRMHQLAGIFGLNEGETDILEVCLALCLDPNLGPVFAYLQDNSSRTYVTLPLVAKLLGHSAYHIIPFSSSLFGWNLIRETDMGKSEPLRLDIDPTIRNWLLGLREIDPVLNAISELQLVHEPLKGWPVEKTLAFITEKKSVTRITPLRITLPGKTGTGRRSFAAAVSARMGMKLLTIDTTRIGINEWTVVYQLAQRNAWLHQLVVCWAGPLALEMHWPGKLPSFPVQFILTEEDQWSKATPLFLDHRIVLESINVEDAQRLLQKRLPASVQWPPEKIRQIVNNRQFNPGQLSSLVQKNVQTPDEALKVMKEDARTQLGELAQPMDSSFISSDLIIPGYLRKHLDDFHFEASIHRAFWKDPEKQRLFPQGRGLFALFTGAPGTGKTMAAQVLANALGLELFRIDLSALVSKYVGETSKNMERILTRAKKMDAILLFDEADALFGKRTEIKDAHDRFANTDTNYLLQAIEDYPGIAILASNRKANMDGGFIRRIRYILDFPKPDVGHRYMLWEKMIQELGGCRPSEKTKGLLKELASLIEVTGAQIKLAVLSGLFMAKHEGKGLLLDHVLKGLERELLKEDRGLGEYGRAMLQHENHLIQSI